jgi:hypothetical protein
MPDQRNPIQMAIQRCGLRINTLSLLDTLSRSRLAIMSVADVGQAKRAATIGDGVETAAAGAMTRGRRRRLAAIAGRRLFRSGCAPFFCSS